MKREITATIAIVTLFIGVAIPVYFGSISQTLIDGFKSDSSSLEEDIASYQNAGKSVVAKVLKSHIDAKTIPNNFSRPVDAFDSSTLVNAIDRIGIGIETGKVLPYFINSEIRAELKVMLSRSLNTSTSQILNLENYSGWSFFLPVDSNAGAPLDAAITAFALMKEEQAISDSLWIDVRNHIFTAEQGDISSLHSIEGFLKSLFQLMNRFNWSIAKTITSKANSITELVDFIKILNTNNTESSSLLASAFLANNLETLNQYIQNYPISAFSDLNLALSRGQNALNILLEAEAPLHRENSFVRSLQFVLPTFILDFFRSLVLDSFILGILIKLSFFIISGLAISHFLLLQFRRKQFQRQMFGLALSADLAFAVFFAFILSIIIEPQLLQGNQNEVHTASTSGMSLIQLPENKESPMLEATNIQLDKVSIIILILFFLAQVAIYYYSLLKIADIKKQKGSHSLKLKLLENEENLFDAGLYVGLGGTVCSLILLVLGVLNASLIAAYASTLFGIIFVAILKIFNVRPFRNELTIAQHEESEHE